MIELTIHLSKLSHYQQRLEEFRSYLSENELERGKNNQQFILGRGLLRIELSKILNIPPKQIEFYYNHAGKPFLKRDLSFNLSHSGDHWGLVVSTFSILVGIDVEKKRQRKTVDQLARKLFTKSEQEEFETMNPTEKQTFFFQYWTLKEAILKAIGSGMLFPLDQVYLENTEGQFSYIHIDQSRYFAMNYEHEELVIAVAASQPFSIVVKPMLL